MQIEREVTITLTVKVTEDLSEPIAEALSLLEQRLTGEEIDGEEEELLSEIALEIGKRLEREAYDRDSDLRFTLDLAAYDALRGLGIAAEVDAELEEAYGTDYFCHLYEESVEAARDLLARSRA